MNRNTKYVGIWSVALLLVGCDSNKTETGYQPRRLGMNNSEMRSLYAPAFSPESHAAGEAKKVDVAAHRPGY